MLKQHLLVLVAAGALSITAPFAAAQDAPPADQQSQPSHEHPGWQRGAQDPAQRTQELTKRLKLTSDQQAKVQEILQSSHSQMEALHQDSSLSQQDRRTKMMDIHKGANDQVRALLDSNQQKKWDEMQAKREQWMQDRHPGTGAGSDRQGAPPQ
jgi:protein CpxP